MPVVFRHNGARYFFFSNEGSPREPIHMRGACEAKLWVEPEVSVAESFGFTRRELTELTRIVIERRDEIRRAWHEHFG
jgi:hypothetical protein